MDSCVAVAWQFLPEENGAHLVGRIANLSTRFEAAINIVQYDS